MLMRLSFYFQVREALMTSALLRLPGSIPYKRKQELVEGILEELVSPSFNS